MTYELASQLRDAGFPQIGKGGHLGPPDKLVWRASDRVYCPTLSELIAACTTFCSLYRRGDDWCADGLDQPEQRGKTPEEAVARLWLALNRKAQ